MQKSWQAVLDAAAKAASTDISNIKKENTNTETTKNQTSTSTSNSSKTTTTLGVGSNINAKGALIYADSTGSRAYEQYYSSDPVYVILGENNGYWKVRHRSLNAGVTGWFKKSDVKAYAKGTKGVREDQWALIDELGEELQLVPDGNGRLAYLKKGTAVLNADMTDRLMNLAMNPQEVLDRNRPVIGAPHVTHNETVISIEYGDILHIDNFSGDKPENIAKMVDKAFDKHMKQLNADLRKYTR